MWHVDYTSSVISYHDGRHCCWHPWTVAHSNTSKWVHQKLCVDVALRQAFFLLEQSSMWGLHRFMKLRNLMLDIGIWDASAKAPVNCNWASLIPHEYVDRVSIVAQGKAFWLLLSLADERNLNSTWHPILYTSVVWHCHWLSPLEFENEG